MLAACVAVIAAMRGAAAEPAGAERLYFDGQAAFDVLDYTGAIDAWTKSYVLSNQAGLLFNLGQAYRLRAQPGDCKRAQTSYERFIVGDPTSPHRKDAQERIIELGRCAESVVSVPAIVARDRPANPGRNKRVIGITAGAAGGVVLGAGLIYGRKATRISTELTTACTDGCNWDDQVRKHEEGKRAERTQWVLYGAGTAALVAGGVLYYLGSREHPSVAITPTGNGASITWSGSW